MQNWQEYPIQFLLACLQLQHDAKILLLSQGAQFRYDSDPLAVKIAQNVAQMTKGKIA